MKKRPQHVMHRVGVARVQRARRHGVYLPVARVAERDEVIKRVVPAFHVVAKASPINVMNVQCGFGSAPRALEAVSLKGGEVVGVAVLRDGLRKVLAGCRAVQPPWVRARGGLAAHLARKGNAAGGACFVPSAARVKRLTASIARLCVELRFAVFVPRLAWLATNLERVVDAKLRSAVLTIAMHTRCFHAANHTLIWSH